jgi:hypothetical protein
MIFLFFVWGKSRIRQEKQMIIAEQAKQEKLQNKDNIKKKYNEDRQE